MQEQTLLQQAIEAYQCGNFKRSESILEMAFKKGFNHPKFSHLLGLVKGALHQYEEAANILEQVAKKNQGDAQVWLHFGISLANIGSFKQALLAYDKVLHLSPNNTDAISNKGAIYFQLNDLESSLNCANRLIELEQENPQAWAKKGTTLKKMGKYQDALFAYEMVLKINPLLPEAWNEMGILLNNLGRFDEVLECYDRASSINPNYLDPLWNKGLFFLLQGNLQAGLPLYEYRWHIAQISQMAGKRVFEQPTWLGQETLQDKTILLYAEQGFGDVIQFCRYARLVANLGAKVILEAPNQLLPLMKKVSGISAVIGQGENLPPFDYQCPLLSLPLVFKTSIENIPTASSYLVSDEQKVSDWQLRLGKKSTHRIGVVWSSVSVFDDDRKRGLSLEEFVSALPIGLEYVCLQKQIKDADLAFFQSYQGIQFYGDQLLNFDDTAALIDCLDLVITIDTAVAHLSGALGKNTWLMLPYVPDWRWFLNREDTPWYPHMKLYRQEVLGDWRGVFNKINADLRKLS